MSKWFRVFQRSAKTSKDSGAIANELYNEAAGANKVMIVEPDIKGVYVGNTPVGAGKLIKVAASGVYKLEMIGRDFSASTSYKKGNVMANGTKVYVCDIPEGTVAIGAFNSEQWTAVAERTISGIPCLIGDIISTGRFHNAIDVAGFLVEDETDISFNRVQ